ncbi:nucleoside triphosphate pyrophosphohydrolase [Frankia sp. Cr2]|uniref:nucleoside triphosphate pyrophosphohydrolase n=1 Tax=Frankia sp. Cr2 TaxID=3073932 RepID=UPI002AD30EC8|nr:nucleoside triphosphate pyrophosphohydrolase [Frankia sp. Cr2]
MTASIVVLVTSPRVVPGLLDLAAWDLLRAASAVCCGLAAHPQRDALAAAGIPVEILTSPDASAAAAGLRSRACADPSRPVVWLAAPTGDLGPLGAPDVAGEAELLAVLATSAGPDLTVSTREGSRDLPGAKLLDAVAVMDRLRSPGGCPWDAQQTHTSLASYLLEEAYEAFQAIEDGNHAELREELGDVLMQVLFHARIAAEGAGSAAAWDVDDVAAGLTEKLVRRHPHVFGSVTVDGPAAVETNWDKIKDVEKGRRSVTEGVPLSQPSLALAAKLQKRAAKVGVPEELVLGVGRASSPAEIIAGLVAPPDAPATAADQTIGDLLFAAVALARQAGVDPEAALRASARRFRDTLAGTEEAIRAAGRDPRDAGADSWRAHWPPGPDSHAPDSRGSGTYAD